ncbi:MAG: methyltransferase domain-containing protein [Candidatus Dormibacteraceae bacterium]
MGPANECLFAAAGVQKGSRVLDVGTGMGDTSLLAAGRVGPSGWVVATDPSEPLLRIAMASARDQGLKNIEIQVAGAGEFLGEDFDAVIARNSLQFVPDLPAALLRIRAALKPGGRLAALVWPRAEDDPWMGLPVRALKAIGRPPAAGHPVLLPTSLGEGGRLPQLLKGAGFARVQVERVSVTRRFADPAAARDAAAAGMHVRLAMTGLSAGDAERLIEQVRALVAIDSAEEGVAIAGSALVVSGQAPR